MSHLVSPTAHRLGKTQIWANNAISNVHKGVSGGDLTIAAGVEKVSRSLLKRKRLYVIRLGVARYENGRTRHQLIFIPRIKIRPRGHGTGSFLRKSLYKPVNLSTGANKFKRYTDLRKDKIARIRRRSKPKRLNRWLSRRMFRGTERPVFFYRPKSLATDFSQKNNMFISADDYTIKPRQSSTHTKFLVGKHNSKIAMQMYFGGIRRRQKWKYDHIKVRRFNSRKFSEILGNVIQQPLSVKALNFFSYMVKKQVLNYKSHQNHFWNFRYRRYRFQYKNYYDILNSFLAITLLDNSEGFLLSILKITLPLILKIRKFFKFMSSVIRYLPGIEEKYSVFKLYIAGKLAGGTKRTKFHSIGYGVLPVQSLTANVTNNFLAYTHIYGEFGLKLVMCKHNNLELILS